MLSVKSIFHDFPSSGSSLPPPRVTTCRCQEPAMVTTSWPTTTWRLVAGWWRSCCQAFLSLVCCRLFLWRSRRRSLNTWRSQSTCRTSFRLSSRRSTTLSWTKRWCRGGRGCPDARREAIEIENWNWKYFQVTDLDKLHSQQQTEGENKYSTIQKVNINANTNKEGEYKYRRWIQKQIQKKRMIHKVKRYFQVKRGSTSSRVAFFEEL